MPKVFGKYGGLVTGCVQCRRPVDDHAKTCPGLVRDTTKGAVAAIFDKVRSQIRYSPSVDDSLFIGNWTVPKVSLVICECGGNVWSDCTNAAKTKCVVCSKVLGYAEFVRREAEAAWPPIVQGIVEPPPKERWRGSVLGLGSYLLEPGSEQHLFVVATEAFFPNRFRVTADGSGVFANVAIRNCIQFQGAHGSLANIPQEAFMEEAVYDILHSVLERMAVQVFVRNAASEPRRGSVWFEGPKEEK